MNFEHKIDNISKTKSSKNRKIDFSFVSKHCATFWEKKSALFDGGGVFCVSLTRTLLAMVYGDEKFRLPSYTVKSRLYSENNFGFGSDQEILVSRFKLFKIAQLTQSMLVLYSINNGTNDRIGVIMTFIGKTMQISITKKTFLQDVLAFDHWILVLINLYCFFGDNACKQKV